MTHAAMIAGTHSGVGKTTWTLALGDLVRAKGFEVQPFKAGPDYIDPGFHHQISTRRSRNLDLFLLSEESIRKTFFKNFSGAEFAVVEGVMGLFDGQDFQGKASSAEIAKLLGLPVFLVVDGSGMAASAAAVVFGFQKLDPDVRLAGVFFNRVSKETHYQYLKQAVEFRTGVPCLGYLPEEAEIAVPERHLGLTGVREIADVSGKIRKMSALLEKTMDWAGFWKASEYKAPEFSYQAPVRNFSRPVKIAIAYDEAFSFYYEDNFDLLREAGIKVSFFSPLRDIELPDADLLYFGGGFPELYAPALSLNSAMLSAVRVFYREGGWIYAECGGLMYLCQSFSDRKGHVFPFAGLIPGKTQMSEKLQHFGYHEMESSQGNFLFSPGTKVRAHEFHYSQWDEEGKHAPAYILGERKEGFTAPRLIASYQHLHFGSFSGFAGNLSHHMIKERNFVC